MTYLMTSLEELFVIDIIAFADQSHSVIEARNLMLDLMLEAFAEYPVVINLAAAAVAKSIAVAIVKVATESVTSIAVVVTVMAALVCVTYQMHPVVIVAAPGPWTVVICVLSADQFAYLSYQTEFQATVVAAAVTQKHYFEGPTVADAYQRGCFAEPLTVVVAAAAACFEDYSAGQASSVAAAAACPQHCLVVQLIDSVAYLLHLTVAPSAAAAAAAVEVTLAAAAQMPVDE